MSSNAAEFIGDIPQNYDTGLGPNIFEHFAAETARRVAERAPERVLELAAGTGIVTRQLRAALGAGVAITATDLNEPMLEVAQGKLDGDEAVRFSQADAQDLPFDDNSFDLLVCQYGHMFFPQRDKAHDEARRVIRPGGTYVFTTWGRQDQNPFSRITHETLAEQFPDDPPGFYLVPFSLHDAPAMVDELAAAGFADVRHSEMTHQRLVGDYDGFARGLIYGNPSFAEITAQGGDPAAVRNTLAKRLEDEYGTDPMPLLCHLFEATVP